jgi:hypothetical protein
VALLRTSTGRYELFDPVQKTRTPVHARLAVTLAAQAYTLYRPFPSMALRGLDLLTGMSATALGMLTPQASAILIDTAIPDADRGIVLQLGAGLGAAA